MPELPEVETIRLKLLSKIVGKQIIEIKILVKKQFTGDPEKIYGAGIKAIVRHGKYLSLVLDNGFYANIHLKMTGQLLYANDINKSKFLNKVPFVTGIMPGKTTSVIIKFHDNSGLYFNDMRKFGWVRIGRQQDRPKGPDIMSAVFTKDYLSDIAAKSKKPIKTFLLDQEKIAGIGNIYANEILFFSGLSPETRTDKLTGIQVKKLYQSIKAIIAKGIKYQGSSAADEAYVLPDASRGSYQKHFLVYQREGKQCLKCHTLIRRIKQNGRSSFYCPNCQK